MIPITSCESGEGRPRLSVQEWEVEVDADETLFKYTADFAAINIGDDNAYVIWLQDGHALWHLHVPVGGTVGPSIPLSGPTGRVVIGYTDTGSGLWEVDHFCAIESGLSDAMTQIDWSGLPEGALNIWYFQTDGEVRVERGVYAVH